MSDLSREIVYTFRMQDNTAEVATEASEASKEAGESAEFATEKEANLEEQTKKTKKELTEQQKRLALQVVAITGMSSAVSGITNGIIGLGIVSDSTAASLRQVNAAFQIMAGVANGIKSVQLIMELLNVATLKNALLNTYNSVIQNPAALALVGAGAGAAVSAAVILGSQSSSSSSSNTNIIVESGASSGSVKTANDVYTILGGV
ncbi:MAG: hypothetical protein WCS17_11590 [Prevotella sp.]